jgi:hypothetical protein
MHRKAVDKSHLLLTFFETDAHRARLAPAALLLAILVAATLALAIIAGPAAAHEDFPAEWCGGTDCRYAEPQELVVECGAIRVETEAFTQSTPFSQISRWNGPRPAICGRNQKLNRCNPNKGDCSAQPGLGLLLPEDDWADLRKRAARACRDRGEEAMLYGQSVPGLKLPTTTTISRGPTGGGGGRPSSPPYVTARDPSEEPGSTGETMMLEPIPPLFLTNINASVSAVPAPATLGLMVLTLGALGAMARRRK